MGLPVARYPDDEEAAAAATALLRSALPDTPPPEDAFNVAYAVYFTLGAGFLLPWNAFITAVDYFSYLYPAAPVDRVFAVTYMSVCLACLALVVGWAHHTSAPARINSGLALFALSLVVPPVADAVLAKGRVGVYPAYDVTVLAVALAGVADALVQGGVIGSAGEMPERYMQAVCSGTAASGVLVSLMRIVTKAVYPNDPGGLRKSANLYFGVSIAVMAACLVCYNLADRLPVVMHYKDVKRKAALFAERDKGRPLTGSAWRSSLREIFFSIRYFGLGIFLIYAVTLSIFPGYITENVRSKALNDWYPIVLIASFNVFDLVGKSLPAVYVLRDASAAVGASAARLLFFPLYWGCLHGPQVFRTEVPVTVLTCLLGLTNGYLTSILMMLAPKSVPIQHSETAGIAIVLFLVVGLAVGSVVTWVWVI